MRLRTILCGAAGIAVGLAIALLFRPEGLSVQAVYALGILVGAIVWWVSGILPEYVTGLIMAALFIVVAGVPTETVFSSFSDSTWWLLLAAFGLGLGMQKSGLLKRMALGVLRLFPRTFKSQVAGLIAAGTLVGPFIPSMSAKAVMLGPLAMSLSDSMGFARLGKQADGLFLAMFTGVRNLGPVVISASFMGYGLLGLLPEDVQQQFDLVHWALSMLPWFIVVTLLNYLAIVLLYSPRGERRTHAGGSACEAAGAAGSACQVSDEATSPSAACDSARSSDSSAGEAPSGASAGDAPHDEDLGRMSLHERQMAVIMVACVALWVLEPVTHIASHVVALAALAATVACGIFNKADFRSGIAWESLVFIGTVLGLSSVFAYLGIDTWIVSTCQPVFLMLAANPFLFVAGIGVITVLMRFVIVSEMAYMNIFMAFMVPLSLGLGISPWVVGVSVYAMVNPWFALYQNSIYLTAFYAVDGQMVRHVDMAKYCVLYVLICLAGLMVSVPIWQGMGLFSV